MMFLKESKSDEQIWEKIGRRVSDDESGFRAAKLGSVESRISVRLSSREAARTLSRLRPQFQRPIGRTRFQVVYSGKRVCPDKKEDFYALFDHSNLNKYPLTFNSTLSKKYQSIVGYD